MQNLLIQTYNQIPHKNLTNLNLHAWLLAVTETWLRPEDTESFISSITPPGYKFTHVPRNVKKGSGVGLFIKEDLSFEQVSENSYQAFEIISIQISTEGAKDVIFHVVYRPTNLSNSQFLDEFGMFLEGAALSGYENILLGDLNFHLDKHDTSTLKFYDILEQFSFTQLVNTPTTHPYSGSYFGCSMCEGFLLLGH